MTSTCKAVWLCLPCWGHAPPSNPCLLSTSPGVARRHIRVTCPPQLLAIGPVAQDKALRVILAFLCHPQILLGDSTALPSVDIRILTLLTAQGEPLSSVTCRTAGSLIHLPVSTIASPSHSQPRRETPLKPKSELIPAQLRAPSAAAWHSDQGHHPYKGLHPLALLSHLPANTWPITGAAVLQHSWRPCSPTSQCSFCCALCLKRFCPTYPLG